MIPTALVDSYGRVVRDLRVSVTDRCPFRCAYCMPEDGMTWLPREQLLSFEEIERVVRVSAERFGVESVRITGGEPTVRAGLPALVQRLARLGVEVAMTTNGATLGLLAAPLRQAGLARLNVSLDSLRRDRFLAMTRRDALHQVLEGIDTALEVGLESVKVNVVMVRGVNDDEAVPFAAFARRRGVQVRFIEFMPLDAGGAWSADRVVPAHEVIAAVDAVYPLEPVDRGPEPAERWRFRDGGGEIGVIASVTRPFCASCDRIRITADGQLRTCLFSVDETDLRAVLRRGGSDDDLAAAMARAVAGKWAGHAIGNVTFVRPPRSMSQIGG